MRKFLFLFLASLSTLSANGDFEVWNGYSIDKEIDDDWTVRAMAQSRWRRGAGRMYLYFEEFQLLRDVNEAIQTAPGIRFLRVLRGSDRWETHIQLLYDVTFRGKPGGWSISNRNRLQHVIRLSPQSNPWFYRNKTMAVAPWSFTCWEIHPYFADEWFYRLHHGIRQNRLIIGLQSQVREWLRVRTFYLLRHVAGRHDNILGITLHATF